MFEEFGQALQGALPSTPAGNAGWLQAALQLLQPIPVGQTPLGALGQAVAGGFATRDAALQGAQQQALTVEKLKALEMQRSSEQLQQQRTQQEIQQNAEAFPLKMELTQEQLAEEKIKGRYAESKIKADITHTEADTRYKNSAAEYASSGAKLSSAQLAQGEIEGLQPTVAQLQETPQGRQLLTRATGIPEEDLGNYPIAALATKFHASIKSPTPQKAEKPAITEKDKGLMEHRIKRENDAATRAAMKDWKDSPEYAQLQVQALKDPALLERVTREKEAEIRAALEAANVNPFATAPAPAAPATVPRNDPLAPVVQDFLKRGWTKDEIRKVWAQRNMPAARLKQLLGE